MADQTFTPSQQSALKKLYTNYRTFLVRENGADYHSKGFGVWENRTVLKALASEKRGKLVKLDGGNCAKLTPAGIEVAESLFKTEGDLAAAIAAPENAYMQFIRENAERIQDRVATLLGATHDDHVQVSRGDSHSIDLGINVKGMMGRYRFQLTELGNYGFEIKGASGRERFGYDHSIQINTALDIERLTKELNSLQQVCAILTEEQQFFEECYLQA